MPYLSLYRKYRAQKFEEVLGQSHITTTLRNAIRQGKWSHAYLFCGPRGTGKTTTARLLAKALNCEQGPTPDPCDECRFCQMIREGTCMDVVEMDAASETSIEDVRGAIIENAKYLPMEARYKVYIIDEVHDLSAKAFDALLKTLEEPPPHVVFVLATTEYTKVPLTIRSRCQRFDFHRGSIADIVRRLEQVVQSEGLTAEPAALQLIARVADGSWRDALTALEQTIAFSEEHLTTQRVYQVLGIVEDEVLHRLVDALSEGNRAEVLQSLDEQLRRGREPRIVAESLLFHLRALLHAALQVPATQEDYDQTQRGALYEQATRIGIERLLHWWERLTETLTQMRTSGTPRILLEFSLLLLCEEAAERRGDGTQKQRDEERQAAGGRMGEWESGEMGEQPSTTTSPPHYLTTPHPSLEEEPEGGGEERLSPEEINRRWTVYVQKLKEKSPLAGTALEGSSLQIESPGRVVVLLRSELSEQYFKQDARRIKILSEQVAKQLRWPQVQLRLCVQPNAHEVQQESPPQVEIAAPTLEGQSLIEGIKETFNGQEVVE